MTDIEFKTDMEFAYATPRELAPGVVRFVANNPSVFTFKGTNTYIVGTDDLAIIDPGPTDDAHLEAILKHIGGRTVSHIVVTHTHRDHVDGLDKMATATKAKVCGYGRNEGNQGALVNPFGTEYIDDNFNPDMVLHDGDGAVLARTARFHVYQLALRRHRVLPVGWHVWRFCHRPVLGVHRRSVHR